MNATTTNGTRRTLAQQIDRLDGILDGLDEALAGAVADAVRQATGTAVQEAVRLALVEVLTNPEVLALIAGAARTQAPEPHPCDAPAAAADDSRPTLRERLGALGEWAGEKVRAARSACAQAASAGMRGLGGLSARLWLFRRQLVLALGAGAAVGLAAYLAGPMLAAVLSGLATSATALAVQAGLWLKRVIADAARINSTG